LSYSDLNLNRITPPFISMKGAYIHLIKLLIMYNFLLIYCLI